VEHVLVVTADHFRRLGGVHGLRPATADELARLLDPAHLSFRPRADVETDPSFKQLIPYVVLRWLGRLFHYRRGSAGTEARLRALRSVGVGGHVNPADAAGGDVYRAGLLRELAEEVELRTAYTERCLGLIHDDRTPVGRVHVGVVHLFDLAEPAVTPREEGLTETGFAPLGELRQQGGEFETWSQFVLGSPALDEN
jgi:predicted NUDIX family phosphoesterase